MQQQLQQLLETLSSTEPHYIRCVKPNNLLKPAIFENKNVLQQLRCGVRALIYEDIKNLYIDQPGILLLLLKLSTFIHDLFSGCHGGY